MIRAIGDNIVELSLVALGAFAIWGVGYLVVLDIENTKQRYDTCIAADKQWIKGTCIK